MEMLGFFGSLNVALDTKYSVKCMYVSEKDDGARGFIEQEFPEITLIAKTTVELAAREARDVRSGRMLPVPYVDVLVLGFSCISRSTNSKNSKLMLGCIQAGQGDTGETWEQAEQVIQTHRPRKLFAENVKGINQKTPLSEFASDSEYIKVTLGKLGYWSATHMCLAEHFGSETCRYRWMLEGEEGLVKCFHRIIYTEQLLNKLRVDELAFENFVEAVAGKNQSARDSAKRKKLDEVFWNSTRWNTQSEGTSGQHRPAKSRRFSAPPSPMSRHDQLKLLYFSHVPFQLLSQSLPR